MSRHVVSVDAFLLMMGLLSDLAIFQAPEAVLERQLQTNPFHPFQLASGEGEDETKGAQSSI